MAQQQRKYDSTVARIAGNIAAGLVLHPSGYDTEQIAQLAVPIARAIVAEVERTEPLSAGAAVAPPAEENTK